MISQKGILASQFDYDALLFLNAAGITDPTQRLAINYLTFSLKVNGLWTKLKAIYPIVGGTATTHKFNLKNAADTDAAFRLLFVGGWTHSVNGALPNGTNAFANTFYNCNTQSTVSNACFGAYSRTNSITGTQVYGAFTSTNVVRMFHNFSAPNIQIVANPGGIGYTPNVSTGFFLSRRESSTLNQSYRNGVSGGTSTVSTINLPPHNFYFGAANSDGSTQFYTTHQLVFGILGGNATITDADSLNLYNIVQAFQIILGRSIGTQTVSDPDAQAFINAAVINDQVQANAINTLVIDLKANSLWTKMNAIYPMVGGTATTHKFNLKNPLDTDAAFRLNFIGGITHSANGVAFNGTNAYADTFLTASTVLTANDNSLSYYSRTTAASGALAVDMGAFPNQTVNSSGYSLIVRRSDNTSAFSANTTSTTSFAAFTSTTDGRGYFIGSIINLSSRKFYRNGSTIASNLTTGNQSLPPLKIFLGALSNNNVASLFSIRECAFASIGSGLSDAEAITFYNIVQTFQTTLNRQV
jgi:hypothetical protein